MTIVKEEQSFDPFHFATTKQLESPSVVSSFQKSYDNKHSGGGGSNTAAVAAVAGALLPFALAVNKAVAAAATAAAAPVVQMSRQAIPTPETFQPICPASDGFYRVLQSTTANTIGPQASKAKQTCTYSCLLILLVTHSI